MLMADKSEKIKNFFNHFKKFQQIITSFVPLGYDLTLKCAIGQL